MTMKTTTGGNVPEGVWVLNQAKSKKLVPTSHTLWILKDDGERLIWVSIETTENDVAKVTSWDGAYDGDPAVVSGSGFIARLKSEAPGSITTYGEIPDMGPFFEKCVVDPSGKHMICNGQVTTPDGILAWVEDFDWHGPGPHRALELG
jgi:hypothetical protein